MAQSLSKLYIHIIFRVKTTFKQIRKEDRNELYAYIGSLIKPFSPICTKLRMYKWYYISGKYLLC